METVGAIQVLRPDRPADPQPWTYDVAFAPSARDLLPYETTLNPLSAVWARGRPAKGAQYGANREKRNALAVALAAMEPLVDAARVEPAKVRRQAQRPTEVLAQPPGRPGHSSSRSSGGIVPCTPGDGDQRARRNR
jgi:hypothetical protein